MIVKVDEIGIDDGMVGGENIFSILFLTSFSHSIMNSDLLFL